MGSCCGWVASPVGEGSTKSFRSCAVSLVVSYWGVTSWRQTMDSGLGRLCSIGGVDLAEEDLVASLGESVSTLGSAPRPTEADLARSLATLVKPLVAGPDVLFMVGCLGDPKVSKFSSPTYPTYF